MKTKSKIPALRFKGFTDAWEQRKLGDISPLRGGFAFKSSEFRNNGVPIVRISNILSNTKSCIFVKFETPPNPCT